MQKSQIDSATLVLVVIAAGLALTLLLGPFAWLASIAGLILLFVLFSFDQEGYRSLSQSLAFSAVCGFCCVLAVGAIAQAMAAHGEVHLANGGWSTKWLPLVWLFATVVCWAIDRARMNGREPLEVREARRTHARPEGFIPRSTVASASQPTSAATTPAYAPPPAAAPFVAPQAAPPAREYTSATVVQQPVETAAPAPPPVAPATSFPAETPVMKAAAAASVPSTAPEPVRLQSAEAVLVRPGPTPIIPRTGKETSIYLALIGEGLNIMRSVKAEHVGRDFYRIIDEVPEGENWEYQPGQIVRCKKKNLSSGKALVAVEEAPRAQ